jgi:PBSX family phage terminase large subunit
MIDEEKLKKIFSDKQIEVLKYENTFKPVITICEGAVRSGKTRINDYLWLMHIKSFEGQGKKFIMTGTTLGTLKQNVLDDMSELFGINTKLDKFNSFKVYGNTIRCFGTKDYDDYKAIKGFTSHGWLANEITESHYLAVDQAFKRCSGEGSRIFWDCNPSYPFHHVKANYIDKSGETLSTGRVHIKSWHFLLEDNTFLTEEYVESIKRTTPSGYLYDRDILGLWVAASGMIYKDFNPDIHLVECFPPDLMDFCVGVDWGYKHLGVMALGGYDNDGDSYITKIIADNEKGIDWWVKRALDIKHEYGNIPFYCDTARPDNMNELVKAGIKALPAIKEPVIEGISYVSEMFKNRGLFIYRPEAKYFNDEIYNYLWDEHDNEKPRKESDNVMDAVRYKEFTHKRKKRITKLKVRQGF